MKLVKAGESHGRAMVGILTDVPSGITLRESFINELLAQRCEAGGRSVRQKLERDRLNFITGVRGGVTLGNNVALAIENAVSGEYSEIMHPFNGDVENKKMTALRPGHADLPGLNRYDFTDIRNVLEGASARNTCLDVAGGAIALQMLEELGIGVTAFARGVGEVRDGKSYSFDDVDGVNAPYFSASQVFVDGAKSEIERATTKGDSLGGVVEIRVKGIKMGFGGYTSEKRVDSLIAQHIMNVQAVKGVYFGADPYQNERMGTEYVGTIERTENGVKLQNSHSGGIDGGMTNGDQIVITVGVKPIPTTAKGVDSVDVVSGERCISARERADVTAVFALCPILRCVVALALSEVITDRLGLDCMRNIKQRYEKL